MNLFPLSNDFVFKSILKKNKKLVCLFCKELINKDVLPEDVRNAPTVISPKIINGKTIISDVVFEIMDSTVVFMEMQNNYTKHFKKRLEVYISQLISEYTLKGLTYDVIKPVYGIAFINTNEEFKNLFTKVTTFDILDAEENAINFIIVNLRYADKNCTKSDIYAILKLLATKKEKEMVQLSKENTFAKQVVDDIEELSNDPDYRNIVLTYEKMLRDEATYKKDVETAKAELNNAKSELDDAKSELKFVKDTTKIELAKNLINLLPDELIAEKFDIELSIVKNMHN